MDDNEHYLWLSALIDNYKEWVMLIFTQVDHSELLLCNRTVFQKGLLQMKRPLSTTQTENYDAKCGVIMSTFRV